MDEEQARNIAGQLKKPSGDDGENIGKWMNAGNAQLNLDAIQQLQLQDNETVLELGMGNGFFVTEILKNHENIQYYGCDFSPVMVDAAKRINAHWVKASQANFLAADIQQLPFTPHFFDKAFTINTIYFWEDENAYLQEIKRVLKPGGKLIIGLRPKNVMERYPFTKYGFTLFTSTDIDSLLKLNNFETLQIKTIAEPDFEINGEKLKMEYLIVEAKVMA